MSAALHKFISSSQKSAVKDPDGFVPADHYLSLDTGKEIYLIDPLLPAGGSMLLYAKAKVGKSSLALQLMHALAGGSKSWLGFPVTLQGRVLYLQADTPRSIWKRRLKVLTQNGYRFCNDRARFADARSLKKTLNLSIQSHEDDLREAIDHVKNDPLPEGATWGQTPIALIVDTLRAVHLGDENNSGDQQGFVNKMKDIAQGGAVIFIHHDNKGGDQPGQNKDMRERARGSSALAGAVEALMWVMSGKHKSSAEYRGNDIEEGKLALRKKVLYPPGMEEEKRGGVLTWHLMEDAEEAATLDPDEDILRAINDKTLHNKTAVKNYIRELKDLSPSGAQKQLQKFIDRFEGPVREVRPEWFA